MVGFLNVLFATGTIVFVWTAEYDTATRIMLFWIAYNVAIIALSQEKRE